MRKVALDALVLAATLVLLPVGCGGSGSAPDNATTGAAGAGGATSTGGTQGGGGSSGPAGSAGGGGDQTGRGGSTAGEAGSGGAAGAGGAGGTTVAGTGGDANGGAAGTGSGGTAIGGSGGSGSGGAAGAGRGGGGGGAATGGGTGIGGPAGGGGGSSGTDTWSNYAQGFFQTYCVSCHNDDNSGTATRNYHMLANVMSEKATIACGLSKSQADWTKRGCTGSPAARQFPVGSGPKPSDAERDRLILWIDAGTP